MENTLAKFLTLSAILFVFVLVIGCDPHIPPTIEFKTGTGYASRDTTVTKGAAITVGIIGQKREDDMKTFNVSYAYDGASSTTTKETFRLTVDEYKLFARDYAFNVRNQAGTEQWSFVIVDRDGNIAKLQLNITVE